PAICAPTWLCSSWCSAIALCARKAASDLSCFAASAPGLERLTADELGALGIAGTTERGGVAWTGNLENMARANLWLRTASRVVMRVAEFKAVAFYELERHARSIA